MASHHHDASHHHNASHHHEGCHHPEASEAGSFFDAQAKDWDSKPHHQEMAAQAVSALLGTVQLNPESTVALEFGCGTGLGSLLLLPHVRKVVGVDTSAEMVRAFNAKAERDGRQHAGSMQAVQVDLEDPRTQLQGLMPEEGFDLVFSHLTLHHIDDITQIMGVLVKCLRPGGVLAISDFEHSDHSTEFHPSHIHGEVKHHGICPKKLTAAMEGAGLKDVRVNTAFEFEKPVDGGGTKKIKFLLGLGFAQ